MGNCNENLKELDALNMVYKYHKQKQEDDKQRHLAL